MKLELRCGDVIAWIDGQDPVCPVHGPQGVARTIGMPAPRFKGTVTGPHATQIDLGAFSGRLAGSAVVKES